MSGRHYISKKETDELLKQCVGKTLKEVDKNNVFEMVKTKKLNKGIAGAVVEQSVFGYPADCNQTPDLIIDGVETELKTTGIKKRNNEFVAKEPVSVTGVSINKIIHEDDFYKSLFWHKISHMLFVFYLYDSDTAVPSLEYERFPIMGYEFFEFSNSDRETLYNDWTLVRDYVRSCFESEDKEKLLSLMGTNIRKNLMYIDTAPRYPNSPRFRLKQSLVSNIVKEHFKNKTKDDFTFSKYYELDKKLIDLTSKYKGKSISELAKLFGVPDKINKAICETIVCRMFNSKEKKLNSIKIFNKVGIIGKTINLNPKGKRTEDMKLFNIDFDEIQNEEIAFENSSFREYFASHQFLCIIFKETEVNNVNMTNNVFEGFKRICFGDDFIDTEVKKVWDRIRDLIINKKLMDVISYDADMNPLLNKCGNIISAPNFPKSSEGKIFVRGSGIDSNSKPLIINNIHMYNQYIWIKGNCVASVLDGEKDVL